MRLTLLRNSNGNNKRILKAFRQSWSGALAKNGSVLSWAFAVCRAGKKSIRRSLPTHQKPPTSCIFSLSLLNGMAPPCGSTKQSIRMAVGTEGISDGSIFHDVTSRRCCVYRGSMFERIVGAANMWNWNIYAGGWQAYKSNYNLYRNIRLIYNPTRRLVD